jgi:hypothetical protein
VRFPRLFSHNRPDPDELAARCTAADRLVAQRVAALARAGEQHVANPDSVEAFAALEAAEELLFIAEYEQREARVALKRARKRGRFARAPAGDRPPRRQDDRSRAGESRP